MAYLLDTNIVSELRRMPKCHPKVREWNRKTVSESYFISVLTLGEIRKGIKICERKSAEQATVLEAWLQQLRSQYHENILPVTEAIGERWGILMSLRTLPVIDGLLAATAREHHLTLATRNISDFEGTGIPLVNPFE